MKCRYCNGMIVPNMEKIGKVLGGTAAITAIAAIFGLGGGWIALTTAAWGSVVARILLHAKIALVKESQKWGSFFYCKECKADFGIIEIFDVIENKIKAA